jgi:hypothetical protein
MSNSYESQGGVVDRFANLAAQYGATATVFLGFTAMFSVGSYGVALDAAHHADQVVAQYERVDVPTTIIAEERAYADYMHDKTQFRLSIGLGAGAAMMSSVVALVWADRRQRGQG